MPPIVPQMPPAVAPDLADALIVLRERRDWLTARIKAKRSIGWDVEWDTRERDALAAVLASLTETEV